MQTYIYTLQDCGKQHPNGDNLFLNEPPSKTIWQGYIEKLQANPLPVDSLKSPRNSDYFFLSFTKADHFCAAIFGFSFRQLRIIL